MQKSASSGAQTKDLLSNLSLEACNDKATKSKHRANADNGNNAGPI
jgi:hypothetical protein